MSFWTRSDALLLGRVRARAIAAKEIERRLSHDLNPARAGESGGRPTGGALSCLVSQFSFGQGRSVPLDYTRFVVGYHGCDAGVARKVLLGEDELTSSHNTYDWLGRGIYFLEHGPARAMQFAINEANRSSSKIKTPEVVGAYIHLGNCFDLLDVAFTAVLKTVYPDFEADLKRRGEYLPTNTKSRADGTKLLHALDRAVIEYAITWSEDAEGRKFDTVRGAFWEGGPAFPGSEIQSQSHIQVAVRNPDCIVGYFRPKSRLTEG